MQLTLKHWIWSLEIPALSVATSQSLGGAFGEEYAVDIITYGQLVQRIGLKLAKYLLHYNAFIHLLHLFQIRSYFLSPNVSETKSGDGELNTLKATTDQSRLLI